MITFLVTVVGVLFGMLIGHLAALAYPNNKTAAILFVLLVILLAAALMILVDVSAAQQVPEVPEPVRHSVGYSTPQLEG